MVYGARKMETREPHLSAHLGVGPG